MNIDGFQRNVFLMLVNMAALQPHIVNNQNNPMMNVMGFFEERKCTSLYMSEIMKFVTDYPVVDRTGITYKDLMLMERPYYLEFRKIFSEMINEERQIEEKQKMEAKAREDAQRANLAREAAAKQNKKPLTAKRS